MRKLGLPVLSALGSLAFLVACTDGAPRSTSASASDGGTPFSEAVSAPAETASTYAVGGVVTGLHGAGLVLQNNEGDDVAIAADGAFRFPTKLAAGASFAVTVRTQPTQASQTCTVSGATGTLVKDDVTSIVVDCATDRFTVGGTATGLAGKGLVLQDGEGHAIAVSANGTFALPATVPSQWLYSVTVKQQPSEPWQTCALTNGQGMVGGADVTDIVLTCTTNRYRVGGTVAGLEGTLVIDANGLQQSITRSGEYAFLDPVPSGTHIVVSVATQPSSPPQTCKVTGGDVTVGGADISSIAVNCKTNAFTIGGTTSNLLGTGLVLRNNGTDALSVTTSSFGFATPIVSGAGYDVTVAAQPTHPWQTCTTANASGTVGSAEVTDVSVACVTDRYEVAGSISGLAGSGLVLQNNASGDQTVAANATSFSFGSKASGSVYGVTVATQPSNPTQVCTVTNGGGVVEGSATSVGIACATQSFAIGGTVSGLPDGVSVDLHSATGEDISVANGSFAFATKIPSGTTYTATVKTQPAAKYCSVTGGTGTIADANVSNITVSCTDVVYATAQLPAMYSGAAATKRTVFLRAPAGTTFNSNADYAAYCRSAGFEQNQNQSSGPVYTSAAMSNATDYYCATYCCYLGDGNRRARDLSDFQNFGLPIGQDLQVMDRGCGDYTSGSFSTSVSLVDKLTLTGATTFSYTASAYGPYDYMTPKSATFARDGVVVCQEK